MGLMRRNRGYIILPTNNNMNPNFALCRQLADGSFLYKFILAIPPFGHDFDSSDIIAQMVTRDGYTIA